MATLKGKALIAYLVVCVFWGSTYLAIKVGVTELPPFLFGGLRFLVAGLILLTLARALGDPLPRKSDWRTLTIVGLLLLAGGNAFVVWSEQYVGSGIASIFVVTVAMWTALFDAIIPGGSSELNWRVIAGLLLGFLGTLLLVGATPAEILAADKRGPLALTIASASWSLGTVYAKRHPTQASPYMGAAFQMIVGGAAVAVVGTLLGEWASWHLSSRGIGAIAYLVIFGSILGYSAYSYALRHASATIVGTYAYVNPVIAVLLGWLLLHEPVGPRTFIAMGMILVAVVWIQFSLKQRQSRARGQYMTPQLPRDAVLLVVDVQKGMDVYAAELNRNNPDLERNIARLQAAWRKSGRPIIHVQHLSKEPQSPLRPGQPGVEIKDEVRPLPGEPVVQKSVSSAFIGTTLEDDLRRRGATTLVVVGMQTNMCVSTTARMAGNLGFTTYVVSDATATFDNTGPNGRRYASELLHDVALADLNGEFSTVLDTKAVLERVS